MIEDPLLHSEDASYKGSGTEFNIEVAALMVKTIQSRLEKALDASRLDSVYA